MQFMPGRDVDIPKGMIQEGMREILGSRIKAMGWEEGNLRLLFSDGSLYLYKGVPEVLAKRMEFAQSPGMIFTKQIRGKFDYQRVEGPRKRSKALTAMFTKDPDGYDEKGVPYMRMSNGKLRRLPKLVKGVRVCIGCNKEIEDKDPRTVQCWRCKMAERNLRALNFKNARAERAKAKNGAV